MDREDFFHFSIPITSSASMGCYWQIATLLVNRLHLIMYLSLRFLSCFYLAGNAMHSWFGGFRESGLAAHLSVGWERRAAARPLARLLGQAG